MTTPELAGNERVAAAECVVWVCTAGVCSAELAGGGTACVGEGSGDPKLSTPF